MNRVARRAMVGEILCTRNVITKQNLHGTIAPEIIQLNFHPKCTKLYTPRNSCKEEPRDEWNNKAWLWGDILSNRHNQSREDSMYIDSVPIEEQGRARHNAVALYTNARKWQWRWHKSHRNQAQAHRIGTKKYKNKGHHKDINVDAVSCITTTT